MYCDWGLAFYGFNMFMVGTKARLLLLLLYRYLISVILLWKLTKKVDLLPPSVKHMQFGRFLKNGKGITLLKEMLYQKLIHIVYNLNIF